MDKRLLLATQNPAKVEEFTRMLSPLNITVQPAERTLLDNVEETGETFAENALIKARAVFAATGKTTIADDSGLCIDALGGRPGVYSARYLSASAPYTEKIAALLNELHAVLKERRTAQFVCAIAVVTPKEEQLFIGECHGWIGFEPKGAHGFGYDPIFMVDTQSYAELSPTFKDRESHRGRAIREMLSWFEARSHLQQV